MSPTTVRRRRLASTRARFAVAAAALAVAGGAGGLWLAFSGLGEPAADEWPGPTVKTFHSRPDLDPDALAVRTPARPGAADGLIFLAVKRGSGQDGPMIVDEDGRVVWFHPVGGDKTATAFQVQRYRGRPVLTWWEGHTHLGHGHGEYVVMDARYREIARVRSVGTELPDHHELQLTPRGTALMPIYVEQPADLSAVGGPRRGTLIESRIQEVDVATGRLIWQWRSSRHVPVTEGMTAPKAGKPHDYFHINSIEQERDGGLIVSSRNTHAIYKIARPSGRVVWKLGGRGGDFRLGPGVRFHFQHDARRLPDGTLSLFDNQSTPPKAPESRGLILRLDREARTARVVRAYPHPDRLLPGAEGNTQVLPNGNVLTSWGQEERVAEFSRDGRLLLDLALPRGSDTYQAFRFPWSGRPLRRPDVAAARAGDRVTVWASWNGATHVRRWQVVAGDARDRLRPVGPRWRRRGFETTLRVRTDARLIAVRALGADGRILRRSRAVRPTPR